MPKCVAYPGPGLCVLVMDNARIHHGDEIDALVDRYGMFSIILLIVPLPTAPTGVRVEYLPPYSPDLNPIEEAFSKVKAFIRRNNDIFLAERGDGIIYDMSEALSVVTPLDAMGYFIHAGYL